MVCLQDEYKGQGKVMSLVSLQRKQQNKSHVADIVWMSTSSEAPTGSALESAMYAGEGDDISLFMHLHSNVKVLGFRSGIWEGREEEASC